MEFACSHVVCNWRSESLTEDEAKVTNQGSASTFPCGLSRAHSVSDHPYDNRVTFIQKPAPSLVPPPVPPRNIQQRKSLSRSRPPPLPPRGLENNGETRLKANVNVVSLKVGSLVDITKASAIQSSQKPVHCGKCNAVMSSASSPETHQTTIMWNCEFCGKENVYSLTALKAGRFPLRSPPGRDILYMDDNDDTDYENLDDMLIVLCVDISGSMSVTSEISPGNSMRSPTYISRLQGVQEALQMVLSSLQKTSPHRRVALVTFNNEVTVYGDGTGVPLSLRDWALVDYDYVKKEGENYSTPHCIAETIQPLTQKIKELREHGATALGPAALVSVAMASQFTGSKVIICTDGQANIGLGQLDQEYSHCSAPSPYFYNQLAHYAAEKGVIVSVMTFEGEDCRLAEVGRLADHTGGRINIVNIGTVATEIQSAIADNVLATSVMATLLAPDGMYFPYEEDNHRLVREIGNVTDGVEITFQFAVRPEKVEIFQQRDRVPFQLQLSFRTRELQKVMRVITQQKRVTTTSWVWAGSLNMSVLGVHCAQLCARLTMEGRVQEAQRQLRAQQDLLRDISQQKPSPKEESIYGNWISTMSMICEDITTANQNTTETDAQPACRTSSTASISDAAAKVVYQMKRAKSVNGKGQRVAMLEN
ncbi:circularly permutated Ras protein 1 isoform X1 [Ctenopharyngodon idella]|uniref:circularly permutated Ras protein 1 isoform X1 n=1 Tax=Ctenopharyngodon idella TaxID=7959 RepID=UPI002231263A|nr:circularly permutated Ras protein 1 isoform X1 [Ctenopharyngodon idella]XP_051755330.1 circularly permutated Ras protein 1 isoform X1 [Ctenopharyngodon idella]XP_051755331.1 circularly permutated Ras protein 1 isoform X1 [Ctenopharyngodon idella]